MIISYRCCTSKPRSNFAPAAIATTASYLYPLIDFSSAASWSVSVNFIEEKETERQTFLVCSRFHIRSPSSVVLSTPCLSVPRDTYLVSWALSLCSSQQVRLCSLPSILSPHSQLIRSSLHLVLLLRSSTLRHVSFYLSSPSFLLKNAYTYWAE